MKLGHAFGLGHDFRDDTYLMGMGTAHDSFKLSACSARYLAVHPYFNADSPTERTQPPTIELTSSLVRPKDATSIPVRIEVRDSDGLHQVRLYVSPTWPPENGGRGYGLEVCRGLEGKKEAVVEFDYDGDISGLKRDGLGFGNFAKQYLAIVAIDALGNENFVGGFVLVDEGFKEPIAVLRHEERGDYGDYYVSSVAFSPDSKLLATGEGGAGVAYLWDVSTGKRVAEFPHRGHRWLRNLVAFSPDGKLLTTTGEEAGVAYLWDIASGERVAVLRHGEHGESIVPGEFGDYYVSSVAFFPRRQAAGYRGPWQGQSVGRVQGRACRRSDRLGG